MKKTFSKKIIGFVLLFSVAGISTFAENAAALFTRGTVELKQGDSWVPIKRDSVIKEGEIISTGFQSEAIISYKDSTMKLGSLTRITLEQLSSSEKKDSVSAYLSTGSVRSSVKHTSNKKISYTVRNPVAVASVRGTDFLFSNDGTVECYSGAVFVTPAKNFNPKQHGIRNPADGTPGATEEEARLFEEDLPADGNSTAFTKPGDVAPSEKGSAGILIVEGQSTSFQNDSFMPNRPKDEASRNRDFFSNNSDFRPKPFDSNGITNPKEEQKKSASVRVDIKVNE